MMVTKNNDNTQTPKFEGDSYTTQWSKQHQPEQVEGKPLEEGERKPDTPQERSNPKITENDPLSAQSQIPDKDINEEINRRLIDKTEFKGGNLGIDVKDGVVTLTGHVPDEQQKRLAKEIVMAVPSVRSVNNAIEVRISNGV